MNASRAVAIVSLVGLAFDLFGALYLGLEYPHRARPASSVACSTG